MVALATGTGSSDSRRVLDLPRIGWFQAVVVQVVTGPLLLLSFQIEVCVRLADIIDLLPTFPLLRFDLVASVTYTSESLESAGVARAPQALSVALNSRRQVVTAAHARGHGHVRGSVQRRPAGKSGERLGLLH